eukprot:2244900-Lingulodinium_polyedra.AAC.1
MAQVGPRWQPRGSPHHGARVWDRPTRSAIGHGASHRGTSAPTSQKKRKRQQVSCKCEAPR